MWILIIVSQLSNTPNSQSQLTEWRVDPIVHFQEFNTEQSCNVAKSAIDTVLKQTADQAAQAILELKSVGGASGSQAMTYMTRCVPK